MSLQKALRKHATTLVLSTLAAAACVVVFVVDRGSVTTDQAETRKKNLFLGWSTEAIDSVTIEHDGVTGTLTRSKAADDALGQRSWLVTIGDKSYPAEEQRVDQLLGTLEFATSERAITPGDVDPKQLGLETPHVRVVVNMKGRVSTLTIGGPATSPKGAAHASIEETGRTAFHVVTAELVGALDIDPASLRSRSLVPFAAEEIDHVAFERGQARFQLVRPGDHPFELRLAGQTPLAGLRVWRSMGDEIFSSLARAEGESLLAPDVAERASQPAFTLKVVSKKGASTTLVFGGACPDKPDAIVVKASGASSLDVCVPQSLFDDLNKSDADFADHGPFFGTLDEIEEISIGTSDEPMELARKGTGFHVRKPKEQDIEGDTGRALLEPMLALRASSVVTSGDKPGLGLDPPQSKIRIVTLRPAHGEDGGDEDLVEELWLGTPKDETLPALRVSDGALLFLPLPAARAFWPRKTSLRSPVVIDAPETAVRSIRVEEGERVQRISRTEQGGWKLEEPSTAGLAADIGLGTDLAMALCPLRVERFVADKDDGSFGLKQPRLIIELTLSKGGDAGDKPLRLLLGAPSDRGSFAQIEGDDAVFVTDKKVEAAASRWLLDRSPFSFDLGDIVKATIRYRDPKTKPVILERDKGALRIASDPSATARAASLRDALVDLIPEGAVSVGPARKEQGLSPAAVTITIEREALDGADGQGSGKIDPKRTIRIELGADDAFRGASITYARRDGIPATYAIPQGKTRIFVESTR